MNIKPRILASSKKIIGVLLIVAMTFTMIVYPFTAKAVDKSEVTTVNCEGVTYTISASNTKDGREVELTTSDSKDKVVFTMTPKTITANKYVYNGGNIGEAASFKITNVSSVNISDYTFEDSADADAAGNIGSNNVENSVDADAAGSIDSNNVENSAAVFSAGIDNYNVKALAARYTWNWNKKTYEHVRKKYWYQYGTSSSNKTYLQIGCKAKYRIPYYKLSDKAQKNCRKYASDIKSCNKNMNLAVASAGADEVSVIAAAVITVIGFVMPVAAIIAVVTGMVGGFSYAVKCIVDAHRDYDNIADDYALIRSYGTKV